MDTKFDSNTRKADSVSITPRSDHNKENQDNTFSNAEKKSVSLLHSAFEMWLAPKKNFYEEERFEIMQPLSWLKQRTLSQWRMKERVNYSSYPLKNIFFSFESAHTSFSFRLNGKLNGKCYSLLCFSLFSLLNRFVAMIK
jgi:hypothetical protein